MIIKKMLAVGMAGYALIALGGGAAFAAGEQGVFDDVNRRLQSGSQDTNDDATTGGVLGELKQKADVLAANVAAPQGKAFGTAKETAKLAGLARVISQLQENIAAITPPGDPAQIAFLSNEFESLQGQFAALAFPVLKRDVDELIVDIAAVQSKNYSSPETELAKLTAIAAEAGQLKQDAANAQGDANRIAALLEALKGLRARFEACRAAIEMDQTSPSQLWGEAGENWTSASRLPSFSSAGYHSGRKPIPKPPVVRNVRDFGAVGDGVADDTQAFVAAIAATENGALLVPAGRYKITDILKITKSNIVLRGEGSGASVLYLPKSLRDILPNGPGGGFPEWAYFGGFVWVEGQQLGVRLAGVSAPAARGATQIEVESSANVQIGQTLRLVQLDDAPHTLIRSMQGGLAFQSDQVNYMRTELGDVRKVHDWVFKVVAVDGNTVTLDRPLRLDVKPEWEPAIFTHAPTVQEVGVEGLTFEFSGEAKAAHNAERGHNAIHFWAVTNSWVNDVEIVDADYGVNARAFVYNSQFEDIKIRAAKRNLPDTCHHGLNASHLSQDNLFNRFKFETQCVHDITVEGYANGNVFANGAFTNLSLDHHKAGPFENLFTRLYTRSGSTLHRVGGGTNRGPQSAARTTMWNITANNNFQSLPAVSQYPQMNVVGLAGYTPVSGPDRWVEVAGAKGVRPVNLSESQFVRQAGVHEAETAGRLSGGAVAYSFQSTPDLRPGRYTGSGYIDFATASSRVDWKVNAAYSGNYRLDIRHRLGDPMRNPRTSRYAYVLVNGVRQMPAVKLSYDSGGSWADWDTASTTIPLQLGRSTIRLELDSGSPGPNIDYIKLTPQ